MPDLGHDNDYKFVKDAEMATGKFYKYESSTVFTDPLQVVTKEYVDSAPFADLSQEQFFCVGKAGNDSNNGKSENECLLTIGAAIAKAAAQLPTFGNQFNIRIIDGGLYSENITIPEFVHVTGPGARIEGTVTTNAVNPSSLLIGELATPVGGAPALVLNTAAASQFSLRIISRLDVENGPGISGTGALADAYIHRIFALNHSIVSPTYRGELNLFCNMIDCSNTTTTTSFDLNHAILNLTANFVLNEDGVIFKASNGASFFIKANRIISTSNKIYELTDASDLLSLQTEYFEEGLTSTAVVNADYAVTIGFNDADLKGRYSSNNGLVIDSDTVFPSAREIIYSSHPTFTLDTQLVDKQYVDEHTSNSIWEEDVPGNQIKPKDDGRNLNMLSGGYKDDNVTTPKTLGDINNLNFNTNNQTILGSPNEILTNILSAGYFSGGAIQDNLDGTVSVAGGAGYLRNLNSPTAVLAYFSWSTNPSMSLVDNSQNYIYVDYAGGFPVLNVTTNGALITDNENTVFELYSVFREGTELHITDQKHFSNDAISLVQKRLYDISELYYAAGLVISGTGTRNVFVGAGTIWVKLNKLPISEIDTSTGDNFDRYYRDGVGGFTKQNNVTQWDNNNYDDGSGTLVNMTADRWANQFFYIESDGSLVSLYGRDQYTAEALAKGEGRPPEVPARIASHALYIGRVTFETGATIGDFQTAFEDTTGLATVQNHDELGARDLPTNHINAAYLPGRDGGQKLNGGTQPSENLTLVSTIDSTKGDVIISNDFNNFTFRFQPGENQILTSLANSAFQASSTDSSTNLIVRGNGTGNGSLSIQHGDGTDSECLTTASGTSITKTFGTNVTNYITEGSTDTNLINTDITNDQVGIGIVPQSKFHVDGEVRIGQPVDNGVGKVRIQGTASVPAETGMYFQTTEDQYPVYGVLPFNHTNNYLLWDCYFDGAFKSSNVNSNYLHFKTNAGIFMFGNTGSAQGSTITGWSIVYRLDAATNQVFLNTGAGVNDISTDDTMASPSNTQLATSLAIQQHVEKHLLNGIWQRLPGPTDTIFPNPNADVLNMEGVELWVGRTSANTVVSGEYASYVNLGPVAQPAFTFDAPGKFFVVVTAPNGDDGAFDMVIVRTSPILALQVAISGLVNCAVAVTAPGVYQITVGTYSPDYILRINLTSGVATMETFIGIATGTTELQTTISSFN